MTKKRAYSIVILSLVAILAVMLLRHKKHQSIRWKSKKEISTQKIGLVKDSVFATKKLSIIHGKLKLGGWATEYKWYMSPGEYVEGFLDSAGHAWTVTTDNTIGGTGSSNPTGSGGPPVGIPARVVTVPANKVMAGVATGLHDGAFWSADSGRVFMYGLASNCQLGNGTTTGPLTTYEILTDASGNDFSGITSVSPGWGPVSGKPFYAAIKANGGDTVWIWGDLVNINSGSTCAKPTPFIVAVGKTVAKIYAYNSSVHAINTDGSVYVIGGNDDYAANTGVNSTPSVFTHVVFPGAAPIAYLAKGNAFVMAVTTTGDSVFGFGELGWICKGLSTNTFTVLTSPTLLNTNLAAALPIDTMVANHVTWESIKTDGTLWGAGSNEVGVLGVGQTINWNTYVNQVPASAPWNWDVGMGEYVTGLTQIAKGKSNFVHLFGGPQYSFYFFVSDANDSLYTAGRDKAAGMLDGMAPADTAGTRIASAYHMSWNHLRLSLASPLNLIANGHSAQILSKCPGCDAGSLTGTPCSFGTDAPSRPNTNLHAHLVLTPISGGFNWSTSTSTTDASHKLMPSVAFISQSGGTSINLGIISGTNGSVTAPNGTYSITATVIDNSWDTVTDVQSVTVGATQTAFYFSASGGGTACSIGSPCAPSYFNTAYAAATAGDTFYLNRGDVFPIEVAANASGTSGNPIVTTWYGTGPEPIIGGMTTVTGLTNTRGNIWQSAYSGVVPNFLVKNGTILTVSRTPNKTTGYFIPTAMTTNTFTDAANVSKVSVNDSIVYKSAPFNVDKRKITNITGSVLTVGANFTYNNVGGFGWFRYNDVPDTANEFRDSSGTIQLYSSTSPSGILAPTVDTCLLSEGTNQVWDHIRFQGGNNANIILAFQAVANVKFTNDTVDFGFDGFQYRSEGAVTLENVYIAHMTDNGVVKQNSNNYNNVFNSVVVFDAGNQPGMGGQGNLSTFYSGIIAGDSGSSVLNCTIDSVGYIGIANFGSGFSVDSNLIVWFCQQFEDGGAVYTWMPSATIFARTRNIIGNICIQGGNAFYSHNGSSLDFSSAANGIYSDNFSRQLLIANNGIYNVNSCGLYNHGPANTFTGNMILNAGYSSFFSGEITSGPTIDSLTVKNNVFAFVATGPYSNRISTVNNDLSTFGVIDSNYYLVPFGKTSTLFTKSSVDAGTLRTLVGWQGNVGYDLNSHYLQYAPLQFVYSISGGSQSVYGVKRDVFGNTFNGSITLNPYQAKILQSLSLPIINGIPGAQIKFQ